jgi:hypothetical protein
VLVAQQREPRTEQENRREQIPLSFEERVRAHVEELADDGVACAHEHCHQDEPVNGFADALVEGVDERGYA